MSINSSIHYFRRCIADEVNLRAIENFSDLKLQDQKTLLDECKSMISDMIQEEHQKQYGPKRMAIKEIPF